MNKGIRRIIAMTLVVNALSAIEPVKYINLTTTNAYAADYGISSLKLIKGTKSSSIGLYKDEDYKDETSFKRSLTEYYAETVESSVKVVVEKKSGYEVKIFKSSSSTADAYDSGDKIPISKGDTVIYVRTYEDGEFDEDNVKKNKINEYKININREDDEDDEELSNRIYLDDIELSDGDIDFSRKTSKYKVSVDNSVSTITIIATPEDDDDTVKIGGKTVTESGKYKRKINLETGKNEIEIKVFNEDDEKERIYNLTITRKKEDSDDDKGYDRDDSSKNDANTNNTEKPNILNKNKWVKDNTNRWKYYDENGLALTGKWHYNKTYWHWYYFDETGYMKTGWLFLNNTWYYLNEDGSMKTGWHYDHNSWYYLNNDGSMRKGWLEENNKKYYLGTNGTMQIGTKTIDGKSYTFDSSGVLKAQG